MLWLYQRTMFGKIESAEIASMRDLNARELTTFIPLMALAVWIGLYPSPFLRRLDTSVSRVITRVNPAYGPALANNSSSCDTPPGAAPATTTVATAGSPSGGQGSNFLTFAACGDEPKPAPKAGGR
jgi:hypothetical protein